MKTLQPVTAAQWNACGRLAHGSRPTRTLIAEILNVDKHIVFRRARKEDWPLAYTLVPKFDGEDGDADVEFGEGDTLPQTADLAAFMTRQLARVIARADRDGRLDKAQIDGLHAMSRILERWQAIAEERAIQETTKRDDDLAEQLQRIDERIVHLAEIHARELVRAELGRGVE